MNQKVVIGAVVMAAVAFSIGRFTGPKKIEVKEVQKLVYIEKEQKEREQNVTETEKETRFPDGTIIKEKIKTKETQTKTKTETETTKSESRVSKNESRPSWRFGFGYEIPYRYSREVHYSMILEKRLFSEVYLGGFIGTDKSAWTILTFGF